MKLRFYRDVQNYAEITGGHWLCGDGPYQTTVASACELNPGLRQSDLENSAALLRNRKSTATLISVNKLGKCEQLLQTENLNILGEHIRTRETQRNVWLIENVNNHMVSLLGRHFDIDPSFFMEYERTSKWRRWAWEPNMTSTLPSAARSYLVMRYYDLRDVL